LGEEEAGVKVELLAVSAWREAYWNSRATSAMAAIFSFVFSLRNLQRRTRKGEREWRRREGRS
jgi:hypothetical protein